MYQTAEFGTFEHYVRERAHQSTGNFLMLQARPDEIYAAIGARLAISRNELGLSQASMAEAIGVSLRAYHSYEKGKRGIPVETLVALHTKFGVDVGWIVLGANSSQRPQDLQALEKFETALDEYLTKNCIKIRSEKRGAIVARWYKSITEGREVPSDDVYTWIELVRD